MIMRGDLFSACLDPVVGSEQGGRRPVLVVQNDVGNRYSPTVIVLAITGQINKNRLPTHVPVDAGNTGLQKDSVVLAEQIRTLDKRRLREKIGSLKPEVMQKVSEAMMIAGLSPGKRAAPQLTGAAPPDELPEVFSIGSHDVYKSLYFPGNYVIINLPMRKREIYAVLQLFRRRRYV